MTSINLLYVSALGCHQRFLIFFFQIRGIEAQRTKLGTHCPQWNDKNIKIFITQNWEAKTKKIAVLLYYNHVIAAQVPVHNSLYSVRILYRNIWFNHCDHQRSLALNVNIINLVEISIPLTWGPGSSVGIATDYGLDDPGSVWRRFSACLDRPWGPPRLL